MLSKHLFFIILSFNVSLMHAPSFTTHVKKNKTCANAQEECAEKIQILLQSTTNFLITTAQLQQEALDCVQYLMDDTKNKDIKTINTYINTIDQIVETYQHNNTLCLSHIKKLKTINYNDVKEGSYGKL